MTDERRAKIEAAIADLEVTDGYWTNASVYAVVGGSYGELSQYLKARRAGEAAGGPAVADAAPPASKVEHYLAASAAQSAATARLSVLAERARVELLSEAEEAEELRLERRLSNLQPVLARLQRDLTHEQAALDIAAVQAGWGGLVAAKQQAYQAFRDAYVQLKQAYGLVMARHQQQEQALRLLPRPVQERLSFPDTGAFRMNFISRLPDSQGWAVVLGQGEALPMPDMSALMDVDPGTRALPERLISRALAEGKD